MCVWNTNRILNKHLVYLLTELRKVEKKMAVLKAVVCMTEYVSSCGDLNYVCAICVCVCVCARVFALCFQTGSSTKWS